MHRNINSIHIIDAKSVRAQLSHGTQAGLETAEENEMSSLI